MFRHVSLFHVRQETLESFQGKRAAFESALAAQLDCHHPACVTQLSLRGGSIQIGVRAILLDEDSEVARTVRRAASVLSARSPAELTTLLSVAVAEAPTYDVATNQAISLVVAPPPPPSSPPPSSPPPSKYGNRVPGWAIIVMVVAAAVVALLLVIILLQHRALARKLPKERMPVLVTGTSSPSAMPTATISAAVVSTADDSVGQAGGIALADSKV